MRAIGKSSQSRDLTILNCDQILGQFKMFVIANSAWVSILGFVAFEITYTLPWVEIKTQFPAITGGISNNSKFYNLETRRIYNYNALVVSDSNEIQSASSQSRLSKQYDLNRELIESTTRILRLEYSLIRSRIATRNDSSFKNDCVCKLWSSI